MARLLLSALLILQAGCSSLFFYPSGERYLTPDQLQLQFEEVQLETPDDKLLYGWWLPAQGAARGTVYFLHGNAQNISAHLVNVSWLPSRGYNVFLLDYRGYGASTGSPDLEGALIDSVAGLEWVLGRSPATPVFVLGQSLGGSLAVLALTESSVENAPGPRALVVDGAFAGFRMIAREKMNQSWLTWPIQAPLSWLIPDNREPVDVIPDIDVPVLVIHSTVDPIVPFHHGEMLYRAAPEPKQFLPTATPHAATFLVDAYQQVMLEFMAQHGANSPVAQ